MEEIVKIQRKVLSDVECYQIITQQCRTKKLYTYFVPVDRIKELDDDDKSYNFFPGTRELRPRYIKDFDRFFLSRCVGSLHLYMNNEKFSPDAKFYSRRMDQFIRRQIAKRSKEFGNDVTRWAESTCREFYDLYYQQGQPTWEEILDQYRDGFDTRSQEQDDKLPLPYQRVKTGGKFYGCYHDDEMRKRPLTTPKSDRLVPDYFQILLCAFCCMVFNNREWMYNEAILKEAKKLLCVTEEYYA